MFQLWSHLVFLYAAVLLPWGAWRRGRRMAALAAAAAQAGGTAGGAPPNLPARARIYRATVMTQWLVTLALLAAFWKVGLPWSALGLSVPRARPLLVVVLALAVALPVFVAWRARRLGRPDAPSRLRARFAAVAWLVPRTAGEWRGFVLLAVTAGVCEELLYRGFLLWYLAPHAGVAGAAVLGTAVFGLAHAYQGWRNALRTAVVGAAHWVIYLLTGSILPGMLLHVAIDLDSMALLRRVFAGARPGGAAEAVAEAPPAPSSPTR